MSPFLVVADGGLTVSIKTAKNMTHSLSAAAQPLLHPSRFYQVSEISATPALVPRLAGVYAWWFSKVPDGVPHEGVIERDNLLLLYVGIAPRRPSAVGGVSKRTLRNRLLNHCRGPIGSSTLRRTLVAILGAELRLRPVRRSNGKLSMSPEDESSLSRWMDDHARVNWIANSEPWEIEDYLISEGARLPLNIRGSSDPFATQLSQLRSQSFR